MTPDEMLVGTTWAPSVRYVVEGESRGQATVALRRMETEITVRDWDVTDPEARYEAAIQEVGPITDEHRTDLMWFIHPGRNAAGLCVFRPWEEMATPASSG